MYFAESLKKDVFPEKKDSRDQMTILYVDDDIEDIEIFEEAVKTVDPTIRYISATSADEALNLLNNADPLPDHVFLDINMPRMDGTLCLKEMRKQKKFEVINVIVYSTNSFPSDIEQIQTLGAQYIRKANSFRDLCHIIRALVISQ